MKTKFYLAVIMCCMSMMWSYANAMPYDFFDYDDIARYEKSHKVQIKAVKDAWEAKSVMPVFDIFNDNKLLGYVLEISGKKLQKKIPSYNGSMKTVSGFIGPDGDVIIPFDKYSSISPCKNDDAKYIWLKVFSNNPKLELAHGVVDLQGNEIVPALYNKIEYVPGGKKGKSQTLNTLKEPVGYYIDMAEREPSFEAQTYTSSSSADVSVYGIGGSLRISHVPQLSYMNLGGYIATKTGMSKSILDRLSGYEGASKLNYKQPCVSIAGEGVGIYGADGKMLLHNDYDLVEIFGSKDSKPMALDGKCYVERHVGGVKSCGIYDLKNDCWVVPTNFAEVTMTQNGGKIVWNVKRDELSSREVYDADTDYSDRFVDEGAKLYNQRRYADAINYYARNGISSPVAKAYSAFSLFKIATADYNNMSNEVQAVEHFKQNGQLWTKPLSKFDFNLCRDYLNMAFAAASEYLTMCNSVDVSKAEKGYASQIESLLYDIDYYKGALSDYNRRYQAALNYIGNSVSTQARQEAMQAAYINAFTKMFTNMISSSMSSSSGSSKSVKSVAPAGKVVGGGSSSGSSSSSSSSEPSVQWKKDRVRDLMKQRDYYLKVIDREESRSDKSTTAINLIQSSKRHLQEIEEELRKWSN